MNGSYKHTIDAKGRLFIPVKLRRELGESFYVTKGLDGCLSAYPLDAWESIGERLSSLPLSKSRNLQRMLHGSAVLCELDAQGRIVVPQILRKYASLTDEVTILGVGNRVELWNASAWEEIEDGMTADDLANAMDELGF